MRTTLLLTAAIAAAPLAALAAPIGDGIVAYTTGDAGTALVRLDGPTETATAIDFFDEGGAPITEIRRIDALAFRPATEQLYGYGNDADTVYLIDTMSGTATEVVSNDTITLSDDLGFDFNNQVDAARIVTADEENVVFFPSDRQNGAAPAPASLQAFTPLFFGAGDPNEGVQNPNVFANAYTNQVNGEVSPTTQQYVVDSSLDILATLANNAGTLGTVGALGIDVNEDGGFDIASPRQGVQIPLGLFQTAADGEFGIYDIDLMTGAASLRVGLGSDVAGFNDLRGFAITNVAAIPLPAAGWMLIAGLGGLAATRRRKG